MLDRNVAKVRFYSKPKSARCVQPDYRSINAAAMESLSTLLERWLPGGRFRGGEYIALNPNRDDKRLGSFRISTQTGRWADFATQDRGGDVISLYAFLNRLRQSEALEFNPLVQPQHV